MKYDLIKTDNLEFLLVMDGKEIIAHLPLKENKTIEGVDLLPPLPEGEDVEELAKESVPDGFRTIWKNGYNKAKENYVDIINKIERLCDSNNPSHEEIWRLCHSLQQPKLPVAFECDTETPFVDGFTEDRVKRFYGNPEPKTITTPEGNTQWVGKYIF
jgi:hypothetical protein